MKIIDLEARRRGSNVRRRHAGGQFDADVHDAHLGAGDEIGDPLSPEDIGDLVRIANTVVTPRGSTNRSNSSGETSEDSM